MNISDLRERISRYLIKETNFIKVKDTLNEEQIRSFINQAISDFCQQNGVRLDAEAHGEIIRLLVTAATSMGPLRPLMEDPSISEIMVNGAHQVYIQRQGRMYKTDITFKSGHDLHHTVQRILAGSGSNKRIDESSPYVDFSLPDGSRVNIILPPCSIIGPVMTIRKFSDKINTVDDLIELRTLDKKIATLLIAAMKSKFNVIFCGATGSGKTTMLNVLSRHIPSQERIVTIEDTPELRLEQDHVVNLTTRQPNIEGKGEVTMRDLFINSLRMRPDRVIIGEIRGGELLDLIQSISSGHSGSLAVMHSETVEDCVNRMLTIMLMTGIRLETAEILKIIARSIDLVVHVELFMDGHRRITTVSDVYFDETRRKVIINDIFKFKQKGLNKDGVIEGEWEMDKTRPSFMPKFEKHMTKLPEGFFEK